MIEAQLSLLLCNSVQISHITELCFHGPCEYVKESMQDWLHCDLESPENRNITQVRAAVWALQPAGAVCKKQREKADAFRMGLLPLKSTTAEQFNKALAGHLRLCMHLHTYETYVISSILIYLFFFLLCRRYSSTHSSTDAMFVYCCGHGNAD